MRVLMTADTLGGVFPYAVDVMRSLRGVDFLLATMGRTLSAAQREELTSLENCDVEESEFRLEWMEDAWSDVERAGEWLLQLERRFGPDVIHLNGYTHAASPFSAPVLVVAHSCVASWWRAVKREPLPASWEEYTRRVQRGLRAANLVVAPTQSMLDALHDEYEFETPSYVIPNGRAASHSAAATKQPFILVAGRFWDEAKNLTLLNEVAPDLGWPVRVAGDLTHEGSARRPENAEILGALPFRELSRFMSEAGIFAHPAKYEPFGLAVLEAAQRGCALVLGDIPSLRELWHDVAVFVDPFSAHDLRLALIDLIGDAERRERLGEAARLRSSEYTLERLGAGYAHTYAAVAADCSCAIAEAATCVAAEAVR